MNWFLLPLFGMGSRRKHRKKVRQYRMDKLLADPGRMLVRGIEIRLQELWCQISAFEVSYCRKILSKHYSLIMFAL